MIISDISYMQSSTNVYTERLAEWLTLLLRIQEVLGSSLDLESAYPDRVFSWFSQFLQANAEISTLN
jgi:hypothetical protein